MYILIQHNYSAVKWVKNKPDRTMCPNRQNKLTQFIVQYWILCIMYGYMTWEFGYASAAQELTDAKERPQHSFNQRNDYYWKHHCTHSVWRLYISICHHILHTWLTILKAQKLISVEWNIKKKNTQQSQQ